MRKLIYWMMVSVDGYIEGPNQELDWISMDDELHTYVNQLEREIGLYLNGRRMYEVMAAYWPTADKLSDQPAEVEFALIWQQKPQIVFSSTLERVEGNATLLRGSAVEEVTRLKQQPGADIEVGGAQLAGSLMQAGLVDEYRLFIIPVILGAGTRMIPLLAESVPLRLVETHAFSSGVVYLRYERQV